MKKLGIAVVAAVVGCSLGVLAQNPRIDGKWDVKMEMSMPGSSMQMPLTSTTTCITKEEAADPQRLAPDQGRGAPSDCKVSDYKMVGNKLTYNVKCLTPPSTMKAEMVYGVDKYDGTMTVESVSGNKPMTMVMKYTAKRLGDCVK